MLTHAVQPAADLVQLLTDKVEENPANCHTLVRILAEDRATYKIGPQPEAGKAGKATATAAAPGSYNNNWAIPDNGRTPLWRKRIAFSTLNTT